MQGHKGQETIYGGGIEVFSSEILLCSILMVSSLCINQWEFLLGESIDRVCHSGTLGAEVRAHKYSETKTTHCCLLQYWSHPGIGIVSEILYQIESGRREDLPGLSTGEDLAPASEYLWHGPLRPVYPTTGFQDIFVHIRLPLLISSISTNTETNTNTKTNTWKNTNIYSTALCDLWIQPSDSKRYLFISTYLFSSS